MKEAFLSYLESEKRYSKHTVTSYRTDLSQFEEYLSSTYDLEYILEAKQQQIRSWMAFLRQSGLEPRSISRKLACIKSIFKYAIRKKLIFENPTDGINSPKIRKKIPVFLPDKDLNKLLNVDFFTNDFEGTRDRIVLEILYGTGIRLSELIGLRVSDINHFKSTVRIRGKGNKERVIPVNKSLMNIIEDYYEFRRQIASESSSDCLILRSDGKSVYPMMVYRIVKKYLNMITTVEKKSPHVLRHSFATHLLNKGADLNAIKDLLGHENLAATQIYTHNSLEQLKSAFKNAHPKA